MLDSSAVRASGRGNYCHRLGEGEYTSDQIGFWRRRARPFADAERRIEIRGTNLVQTERIVEFIPSGPVPPEALHRRYRRVVVLACQIWPWIAAIDRGQHYVGASVAQVVVDAQKRGKSGPGWLGFWLPRLCGP